MDTLHTTYTISMYITSHIQVALPEAVAILPRHGHSATGFGAGPHCRQLVLWGGQKILWGHPIGETTLLNFGEDFCVNIP